MQPVSLRRDAEGQLGVALRGEIDFTNATDVREAVLAELAGDPPSAVVVDLSAVTFLDSSGIGVLVTAMRAAGELGTAYRVAGVPPKIFDQLRTVGLVEVFGLVDPCGNG